MASSSFMAFLDWRQSESSTWMTMRQGARARVTSAKSLANRAWKPTCALGPPSPVPSAGR